MNLTIWSICSGTVPAVMLNYAGEAGDGRRQLTIVSRLARWWTVAIWMHVVRWSKRFRSSEFPDLCRVVHGSWREVIWDRYPRQWSRST